MLEGKMVLNETMSLEQFYGQYFEHESTEDLPGDNSWDRYIAPRYAWTKFNPTAVTDGSLSIEFNCPSTFGCTVSGMLIYPSSKEATAAAFVVEATAAMELRYTQGYMQYVPTPEQPAPPPTNTANASTNNNTPSTAREMTSGTSTGNPILTVFQRPVDADINAYDSPQAGEEVGADGVLNMVSVCSIASFM
jgi:hypothetical protein